MSELPVTVSPYRVPRSRIDDNFDKATPLPFVQVGAAEVLDVSADGETCTVDFGWGDDPVAGVVVLGDPPEVADWVEVHARGDLLVTPETPGTSTGSVTLDAASFGNAAVWTDFTDHSYPVIFGGGSLADSLDSTGATVRNITTGGSPGTSAVSALLAATGPIPSTGWAARLHLRSKVVTGGTGYHCGFFLNDKDSLYGSVSVFVSDLGLARDSVIHDTVHELGIVASANWANLFDDGGGRAIFQPNPTTAVTPDQTLDWTVYKAWVEIYTTS